MKRTMVVAFFLGLLVSLMAVGAWGQSVIDDQALQSARDRARSDSNNRTQEIDLASIALTELRNVKMANVDDNNLRLFDQEKKKGEDARETKHKGMSRGKKWAIAGAVVGGVIVTAVLVTKPWRSE